MGDAILRAATALRVFCIVASMTILAEGEAVGQAQKVAPAPMFAKDLPPLKQVVLTESQIKGLLAAENDIKEITDKAPENIDQLSAETTAKVDAVARRNGFSNYAEYLSVSENVGLVVSGIDPVTKKHIGREAVIRAKIARIKADKRMSAEDKKELIDDLNSDLQFPPERIQNKGNVNLVVKYYDKLVAGTLAD